MTDLKVSNVSLNELEIGYKTDQNVNYQDSIEERVRKR